MTNSIIFDPLFSWLVVAALAGLTALFIALGLWRGLSGWWLRAGMALTILIALANPSLKQEERNPLTDFVLVVVDESASQTVTVRPEQIAEAVAELTENLLAFEVKTVTVGDAPEGSDRGTMLMTALSQLQADIPVSRIAGAILVTDGQVHDIDLAPDIPAPVHVLLTGEEDDWDRRLIIKNAPAFAIIGEPTTMTLRVEDQGAVPSDIGNSAELIVTVDGGDPRRYNVPLNFDMEVPLELLHGGLNVLQFNVTETEGELTTNNNAAVVSINGVRDRLRVLLVSGEPHAGERTWRNLLKADSAVDLVHFTILRSPGKQDGVPSSELSLIAFPTNELFTEKIDDFDLIIFDRYRRRGLLPLVYLDNVSRYVKEGGAVLFATGAAFAGAESLYRTPLEQILPAIPTARVFEKGFLPRITDLGERHPVTQGLMAFAPRPMSPDGTPGWGRWFRMIDLNVRTGRTLMKGAEERPLLVLDRVGEGRVAMLASDHAWLWHRGFEGGGPQGELLRRLAHWMMKEPELEEEALQASALGRSVTIVRRTLEDSVPPLIVQNPDGSFVEVEMTEDRNGHYTVQFEGEVNGLYRVANGLLEAVVAVGPVAPREFEDTIATETVLSPVAKASGGGFHRLEDGVPSVRLVRAGRVATGRGWMGLTPRNAYVTTGIRQTSLVPALLFLLLSASLLLIGWRREGR